MSKNKKPKKKYTPRTVYYPKLIIGMQAMDPIQNALDSIIIHGEVLTDHDGNYVYKTFDNQLESFEAGLDIYVKTAERIMDLTTNKIDLTNLKLLREQMIEQEGFDEEVLEKAKLELELCKKIISVSPPKMVREIATHIGQERLQTKGE